MKTTIKTLAFLFLLITANAHAANQYSHLYIFGDSLSDTGNLASVVGDLPYPFYNNRISNGPVAVEILAAKLGLQAQASLHLTGPASGSNYAVATAKATGLKAQDLTTQIALFHANHGYVAPADALYLIMIGGNDIIDTRTVSDIEATAIVNAAADSVRAAILSLSQAGARNFLLVNSPDISVLPASQLYAQLTGDPHVLERLKKYSKHYRDRLDDIEDKLSELSNIEIEDFDLFKRFNKLIKNAADYGFINTQDACFNRELLSFHPDCQFGLNFDQFVFFDELHPTAKAHLIIGEEMYKEVIDNDDEDKADDKEDD